MSKYKVIFKEETYSKYVIRSYSFEIICANYLLFFRRREKEVLKLFADFRGTLVNILVRQSRLSSVA